MAEVYCGFTEGDRVLYNGTIEAYVGFPDNPQRDRTPEWFQRHPEYIPLVFPGRENRPGLHHGAYFPSSVERVEPPPPPLPQKCIPGAQSHEMLRIYHWARDQNGCAGVVMRPAAEYDYEAAELHGVDIHDAAMIDSDWYIETVTWLDDSASASTCCTIVSADGTNIATWEVQ